jgi:hypothetical protein
MAQQSWFGAGLSGHSGLPITSGAVVGAGDCAAVCGSKSGSSGACGRASNGDCCCQLTGEAQRGLQVTDWTVPCTSCAHKM